jgi:hypothetical protein
MKSVGNGNGKNDYIPGIARLLAMGRQNIAYYFDVYHLLHECAEQQALSHISLQVGRIAG